MVYICPDTFSGHSSFWTLNMADTRYRINSQKIAAETIEGEVVIVNFVNGNYYSLNNLAADVWNWLVDAHTVTEIVAHLRTVFPEMDGRTIDEFVNALVKDDLLEHDPSLTAAGSPISISRAEHPFAAPVLEKHDDMQELILLDPIHEVGDSGWPHRN